MAEGGGFFFAEGAEFAGTALDDGAWDFVCEGGGFGAGALGKREDVEIGEGQAFDEGHGCGVVFFGFAEETGDDGGADSGVGEALGGEFDAAGGKVGAGPAGAGGEGGGGG